MLFIVQYTTSPEGNGANIIVKKSGKNIKIFACIGSGGVGLSFCWINIDIPIATGHAPIIKKDGRSKGIKPNKLKIENSEDKSTTTVVAEPLEKGYALTIGNSLRRILLSSIQGSAITAIQIDGVLHEFSSIKGVREDVTDIVLNVKLLSLQVMSDVPKKLILDVKGPGEIKAKDIQPNPDVKILNPDLVLCHLDENTKF